MSTMIRDALCADEYTEHSAQSLAYPYIRLLYMASLFYLYIYMKLFFYLLCYHFGFVLFFG